MKYFTKKNVLATVYSVFLYTLVSGSDAKSKTSFFLKWDDTQYLTYITSSAIETSTAWVLTRGEFNALSPAARLQLRSEFIDNLLTSGFVVALQGASLAARMASLNLEIALIPDKHSPHGFSFNVMVSLPDTGALVATLYTYAEPRPVNSLPIVYYGTNDEGYERTVIVPKSTYSLKDVAKTLADELVVHLPQQ